MRQKRKPERFEAEAGLDLQFPSLNTEQGSHEVRNTDT